jgi:hypothetical protein
MLRLLWPLIAVATALLLAPSTQVDARIVTGSVAATTTERVRFLAKFCFAKDQWTLHASWNAGNTTHLLVYPETEPLLDAVYDGDVDCASLLASSRVSTRPRQLGGGDEDVAFQLDDAFKQRRPTYWFVFAIGCDVGVTSSSNNGGGGGGGGGSTDGGGSLSASPSALAVPGTATAVQLSRFNLTFVHTSPHDGMFKRHLSIDEQTMPSLAAAFLAVFAASLLLLLHAQVHARRKGMQYTGETV